MRRLIYHVDVNSAFLSWESVRRLSRGESDLRTIPSAISGDPQKRHGVILAKSQPAKAYGVKTGEPLVSALQKCPQLVLAPPDHALYERMSAAFVAILREFAPVVEQVSVDECYLDMSGMERIYPDELQAAYLIRDTVRERLGFTVNVGVARNKLLAKMASDFEKPDRVHTLFDEEIPQKMWPLPVRELYSVGRATADKLQRQGIKTIGVLASLDPSLLTPPCVPMEKPPRATATRSRSARTSPRWRRHTACCFPWWTARPPACVRTAHAPTASASASAPISSKTFRISASCVRRPTSPPRFWSLPSSCCASFGIAACRCV